jgi:myo-inositol-1(or 4)-monophosphatase
VTTTPIEEILALDPGAPIAWAAADRAGTFLLHERPADMWVGSKSSPTDPVTEMDRGAERIIVDSIRAVRPDDGFLGEEGSDESGTTGVRWVIDPLDGTVNYVYNLPIWAVSIGMEVDGRYTLGVVNVPAQGESFIGITGHGSWHVQGGMARRITSSHPTDIGMAMVATGFGYDHERRMGQARIMAALAPRVRDFRRLGSCAVDLCWLAAGRFDVYYEVGVNAWDFAAGAVIAREAGVMVTGLHSPEPTSEMIIAAPAALYKVVRPVLQELH